MIGRRSLSVAITGTVSLMGRGANMPIKKTKIRTGTSRILAEPIVGPRKQPIRTETSDDRVDGDAPRKSPAQG